MTKPIDFGTPFTKKLRERAESCRAGRPKPKDTAALLDEAAKEIERWRSDGGGYLPCDCNADSRKACGDIHARRREIYYKRLKEAASTIREFLDGVKDD